LDGFWLGQLMYFSRSAITTSGTLNNGSLVQALFYYIVAKKESYRQFCINAANGELIHGGLQKCHKSL
jgi:hypothetical protein